jgi:FkbM family methyltransferase
MIHLRPRRWANRFLGRFGYEIGKLERRDLFYDIRRFLPRRDDLMIFDVGANLGQTARKFKKAFRKGTVHSFEPSPVVFQELKRNVAGLEKVFTWNMALGSKPGQQTFFENEDPKMSSFLPLGELGWGLIEKETVVEVNTLDRFCVERRIESIDVLKSDTQGYEFEVFQGAEGMMQKGRVGMIYCEIIFSEIYRGMPGFEELLRYLNQYGFVLEAFYKVEGTHRNRATWTDALFVHERYLSR